MRREPLTKIDVYYTYRRNWIYLLAHALIGSIAELYTLIFENALVMQSFLSPHPVTGCLCEEG